MRRLIPMAGLLALTAAAGCTTMPGLQGLREQLLFSPGAVSGRFPASPETLGLAVESACAAAGVEEEELGLVLASPRKDWKANQAALFDHLRKGDAEKRKSADEDLAELKVRSGWFRGRTTDGKRLIVSFWTDRQEEGTEVMVRVGDGGEDQHTKAQSLLDGVSEATKGLPAKLSSESRVRLIERAKVDLRSEW